MALRITKFLTSSEHEFEPRARTDLQVLQSLLAFLQRIYLAMRNIRDDDILAKFSGTYVHKSWSSLNWMSPYNCKTAV
jgi:hypothetical protein